jgi:hypothetical protein
MYWKRFVTIFALVQFLFTAASGYNNVIECAELKIDEVWRFDLFLLPPYVKWFKQSSIVGCIKHYRIKLDVDYDLLIFRGSEKIKYPNCEGNPLYDVYLRIYANSTHLIAGGRKNLILTDLRLEGKRAKYEEIRPSLIRIRLNRPLQQGDSVDIGIDFKGSIPQLPKGSGDVLSQALQQLMNLVPSLMGMRDRFGYGYGIFAFGDGIVSLGGWYPAVAVYDEGGWDIAPETQFGDYAYYDPSNYEVEITTDSRLKHVTTGIEIERRRVDAERVTTRHVAFLVRDFAVQLSPGYISSSKRVGEVNINSHYLRESIRSGRDALEYASDALKFYSENFGGYPYLELDIVEAPLVGGAGGMEYPGLCTIASFLYEKPKGDELTKLFYQNPFMKRSLEFVVAHEVAHQWWNAVVGSNSRKHPFVDEALASYSAMLYFENYYGKDEMMRIAETQVKLNYQIYRLMGGEDGKVDRSTDEFENALEYAAMMYGKAPMYYHEIRELVGLKDFLRAARSYYNRYTFEIAGSRDFTEEVILITGRSRELRNLYRRWIHGKKGDEDIGIFDIMKLFSSFFKQQGFDSEQMKGFEHLMKMLKKMYR